MLKKILFATFLVMTVAALGAFITAIVVMVRTILYNTPWEPAVYAGIGGVVLLLLLFPCIIFAVSGRSTAEERQAWSLDEYIAELTSLVGQIEPWKETGLERNKDYVKELGAEIDAKFGFAGMQAACEAVASRTGPSARSDLNRIWNGIGRWRS